MYAPGFAVEHSSVQLTNVWNYVTKEAVAHVVKRSSRRSRAIVEGQSFSPLSLAEHSLLRVVSTARDPSHVDILKRSTAAIPTKKTVRNVPFSQKNGVCAGKRHLRISHVGSLMHVAA